MINAGSKVVLSTDDPAFYQTTFSDEFLAAYISGNLDIAVLKVHI
jgi:adenosine deaminase